MIELYSVKLLKLMQNKIIINAFLFFLVDISSKLQLYFYRDYELTKISSKINKNFETQYLFKSL